LSKAGLIVEVDGVQHYDVKGREKDRTKDDSMAKAGMAVMTLSPFHSFYQNNRLMRAVRLTHLALHSHRTADRRIQPSLFTLHGLCFSFVVFICLSGATVSGAEISVGAEAGLKKVIIRKQFGPAHDMFRKEIEEIFHVEVIRDSQGLEKGLSGRESMHEDNGMLFVLDASQEHAFWMKGMKFPLDIIFIGENMRITEIRENLQPCEECPIYFPKVRPAYALEINAGLTRKRGLSVNDTMVLEK
jgi:uncharacterized membrane protein (UPF0127 family)